MMAGAFFLGGVLCFLFGHWIWGAVLCGLALLGGREE